MVMSRNNVAIVSAVNLTSGSFKDSLLFLVVLVPVGRGQSQTYCHNPFYYGRKKMGNSFGFRRQGGEHEKFASIHPIPAVSS